MSSLAHLKGLAAEVREVWYAPAGRAWSTGETRIIKLLKAIEIAADDGPAIDRGELVSRALVERAYQDLNVGLQRGSLRDDSGVSLLAGSLLLLREALDQ